MKKSKAKKKLKKINPHSKAKVKALKKAGAAEVRTIKSEKDLLEQAPDVVNEVRASTVVAVEPAEVIPPGLVEVSVDGTSLKLLGMRNQAAIPTTAQRVAMARRLNRVGPSLPRYVKMQELKVPTTSIGEAQMGKAKEAIAGTGLSVKDVEKLHAEGVKDAASREKQAKADAAKKAKEDEAQRKKDSAVRKKLKTMDVTPKVDPNKVKTQPVAKGKSQDPGAKVKGVSTSPAKPKAGMNPGAVPKGGFTKDNKPTTSGELIRARIGEHKMTDDAIAAEVRKLWPGRTTAVSDVRWNRSQMQKAGVKNVPEPVEGSTVPGKK